jgi:hypothetical protein
MADGRKFRAIVLVMSESGHRMLNTIAEQRDIIAENTCTLEMIPNGNSLIVNITQGNRYICTDESLDGASVTINPVCTKRSFTKHKLFAELLNELILKSEIYCLILSYGSVYADRDMSIYFRYDGTVFIQTSGDYGDDTIMIKLDSESAFSALTNTYRKFHFRIFDMTHNDGMFSIK